MTLKKRRDPFLFINTAPLIECCQRYGNPAQEMKRLWWKAQILKYIFSAYWLGYRSSKINHWYHFFFFTGCHWYHLWGSIWLIKIQRKQRIFSHCYTDWETFKMQLQFIGFYEMWHACFERIERFKRVGVLVFLEYCFILVFLCLTKSRRMFLEFHRSLLL